MTTFQRVTIFYVCGTILLATLGLAHADETSALKVRVSSQECLRCHAQKISPDAYFTSVHKETTCLACHLLGSSKTTASVPGKKCIYEFKGTDCARCHEPMVKEHASSVHNSKRLPVSCAKCHFEIHAITSHKGDKIAIAKKCGQCHKQAEGYLSSDHYKSLVKGSEAPEPDKDAATCSDCHGLHAIAKIDNRAEGRILHTRACLKCHSDMKLMAKHKITTIAPDTFFNSYHGKNVRLGYPQRVAGCADCHTPHAILKAKDPKSSVNPANLRKTCSQCHLSSTASFARFIPHADQHDSKRYPILFWTVVAMTILLAGTFLFFWVHSALWAMRSFIDNRERARAASFPNIKTHAHFERIPDVKDGNKIYRRFKPVHIFLHLLVIISFLGLSLTGLPLKFSATGWGKRIIDFMGGPSVAGNIHRTCAAITFIYFFAAIGLSIHFLFFDRRQRGSFWDKLLGPDSLCPNLRDWHDLKAMFRWFFFRGKKPTFERWTYWEKFDFLAVFWGMFAIGSSGLVLWFPEFFGHVLPGWMFNVATIVHSDEALLATGFIFTVHFFNTHFRPEKFPMDFVIFNGEVSKEELVHERHDQWLRYEKSGQLEELEVAKPSPILWDLILKTFGFFALFTGLSLAAVMVYTLLR